MDLISLKEDIMKLTEQEIKDLKKYIRKIIRNRKKPELNALQENKNV